MRRVGLALAIVVASVLPASATHRAPAPLVGQATTFSANASLNAGIASLPTQSPVPVFATVGADGTNARNLLYAYGGVVALQTYKADGTLASPTAVVAGDTLFGLTILGFNGTAFVGAASLACIATDNFTTTTTGTACTLSATKQGTAGAVQQYKAWGDNFVFSVPVRFGANGYSAAGTTLATATALTTDINFVTGGTGGVLLPPYNATEGGVQRVEVSNISGATINVYPPTSSATIWTLNGATSAGAAGAAYSLVNGSHGTFECYSTTACVEAP